MSVQAPSSCRVAVVGAGAAGLFASIFAARKAKGVVALDGAKTIGAKILVAGGGRCNVTHDVVDELQYAGSTRPAIRNVLRRFDVPQTVAFFASRGVSLKREETGKLFPVTDEARTVLDALTGALREAGGLLIHPWRVASVRRVDEGFIIERDHARDGGSPATITASKVILATGGMALPRTGSDGAGYAMARSLGHTTTPRIVPALAPLVVEKGHWITSLSGLTLPTSLEVRLSSGKRVARYENSTLLTHFGLSGPAALDVSRHLTHARHADSGASLFVQWLPGSTRESLDAGLLAAPRAGVARTLTTLGLPERLARALCESCAIDPAAPGASLHRTPRLALVDAVIQTRLPVTGDRGFTFAEATAGGVPLSEVNLATMESRLCPGLHLCGEILDVDGRVGGYNFQWAWSSGWIAGTSA
ncbi:MAG: NAD(P)/FAD-dependent oxidoreductase [Phycisphaerae bacterium]